MYVLDICMSSSIVCSFYAYKDIFCKKYVSDVMYLCSCV